MHLISFVFACVSSALREGTAHGRGVRSRSRVRCLRWRLAAVIVTGFGSVCAVDAAQAPRISTDVVRIGYFHGGRTAVFYRTWVYGQFARDGVDMELVTRNKGRRRYGPMLDLTAPANRRIRLDAGLTGIGKATGRELLQLLVDGRIDGATIGETAFILAAAKGLPIVAVTELGHDAEKNPAHALVLRRGIVLDGPDSLRGLRLAARRSSGGDAIVLQEYMSQVGLDPTRDVIIRSDVSEENMTRMIARGEIDGAYAHLNAVRDWIQDRRYPVYIARRLDWINPEMSQGLLVFSRKYIKQNGPIVRKIIAAYMKRIATENEMSSIERRRSDARGLQIEIDYQGMHYPQCDRMPRVRSGLLYQWERLMIKHGALNRRVDLAPYIDGTYLESPPAQRNSLLPRPKANISF